MLEVSDLQALISTSQALSQEIVLENLVNSFLSTAIERTGAQRGLILLSIDGCLSPVACGVVDATGYRLIERLGEGGECAVAFTVLSKATETRLPVLLNDVGDFAPFLIDPHFVSNTPKAVLCLPLVAQNRTAGAVYLESNSSVFTSHQVLMLQLLAAQAAISIENAKLFQDVGRAERDARQARDELRQEFDLMPVQVWRTDAFGTLEAANKHWYDFTGMTPEEAQREDGLDTCHPDDRDRVTRFWHGLLQNCVPGELECRMRRSDGEYRSVLARAAPLRNEAGEVVRWLGTTIDIEQLKFAEQAQEVLARVSRITAMGELTVSIAHEINQPLMAIVTNAATCLRWLSSESPDLTEARLAAERVVRDGHRAGDVVASIRALAQKVPAKFIELTISEVLMEVIGLARRELDRQDITVCAEFPDPNIVVMGDRVQVQQLALNLVMNAIEAMASVPLACRLLTIRTKRLDPDSVLISVSDTGQGLGAGNATHVFDAFFTSKDGGMGMGLSICRSIVEGHGGRIYAAANVTGGATFSIELSSRVGGHQ